MGSPVAHFGSEKESLMLEASESLMSDSILTMLIDVNGVDIGCPV